MPTTTKTYRSHNSVGLNTLILILAFVLAATVSPWWLVLLIFFG